MWVEGVGQSWLGPHWAQPCSQGLEDSQVGPGRSQCNVEDQPTGGWSLHNVPTQAIQLLSVGSSPCRAGDICRGIAKEVVRGLQLLFKSLYPPQTHKATWLMILTTSEVL